MAANEILIEGLPIEDNKGVHPSIGDLFFNTHHDYNPKNPDAPINKGYFNLVEEAKDFIRSLKELKVRASFGLTPELLIKDYLPRI